MAVIFAKRFMQPVELRGSVLATTLVTADEPVTGFGTDTGLTVFAQGVLVVPTGGVVAAGGV